MRVHATRRGGGGVDVVAAAEEPRERVVPVHERSSSWRLGHRAGVVDASVADERQEPLRRGRVAEVLEEVLDDPRERGKRRRGNRRRRRRRRRRLGLRLGLGLGRVVVLALVLAAFVLEVRAKGPQPCAPSEDLEVLHLRGGDQLHGVVQQM